MFVFLIYLVGGLGETLRLFKNNYYQTEKTASNFAKFLIRIIKSFKTCSNTPILIILYLNNLLNISTFLGNFVIFPFCLFPPILLLINPVFVLASVNQETKIANSKFKTSCISLYLFSSSFFFLSARQLYFSVLILL